MQWQASVTQVKRIIHRKFRLELYIEAFTTQKCDNMNLRMSQYQQLCIDLYEYMLMYDLLTACYIG